MMLLSSEVRIVCMNRPLNWNTTELKLMLDIYYTSHRKKASAMLHCHTFSYTCDSWCSSNCCHVIK